MVRARVLLVVVAVSAVSLTACNVDVVGADGPWSSGIAINAKGQVVGEQLLLTNRYSGFVTEEGTGRMIDIAPLPGYSESHPGDLNADGVVVGSSYNATNGDRRAFRWDPATGVTTPILGFNSHAEGAVGINDAGTVLGNSSMSGHIRAWVWDEVHGAQDIGDLCACPYVRSTQGGDINEAGDVVGTSWVIDATFGPVDHAIYWDSSTGSMTDLGTLGGLRSAASALNDQGVVVGWSETSSGETHLVQWTITPTGVETLDLTARNPLVVGSVHDVNDAGQISVTHIDPAPGDQPARAIRYTPATDTVVALGGIGVVGGSAYASGINAAGQVVGSAAAASGGYHATIFKP